MNIDVNSLREDLKNHFGTAMQFFPAAMMDLIKVEQASDNEIINIAIRNGFNLADYEIKKRSR